MPEKCNHKLDNGESAIIVPFEIFFGVYPPKHRGICSKCKSYIELTDEEFNIQKEKYNQRRKKVGNK